MPSKQQHVEADDGTSLGVLWLGLGTFIARATVSIPGWGTEIPQAAWHSQKGFF